MRKGFTSVILIVIIVFLTIGAIGAYLYYSDKVNKQKFTPRNITEELQETKITPEPSKKPKDTILLMDQNGSNFFLVKSNGELINKCGAGTAAILSPDKSKVVFFDQSTGDMHLARNDCREKQQLTRTGKLSDEKYYGLVNIPIAWSAESDKILYSFYSEYGMRTLEEYPEAETGLFIFDIAKNTHERVSVGNQFDGWQFVAWPNGTKPLFTDWKDHKIYQLNDNSMIPLSEAVFGFGFGGQARLSSDGKRMVWMYGSAGDGPADDFSRIMLSTLDRKSEVTISPKGLWSEYQWASISPDDKKIKYHKKKMDHSGDTEKIVVTDLTGKVLKDFPINASISEWINDHEIVYTGHIGMSRNTYILNIDNGDSRLLLKDSIIRQ